MANLFRCIAGLGLTMLASPVLRAGDISYELDTSYSYVGSASTDLGAFTQFVPGQTVNVHNGTLTYPAFVPSHYVTDQNKTADVSEQSSLLRLVISPQLTEGLLLRVGTEWHRYWFGLPTEAPLPNTLQSASLVLGADMQLGNSWLLRVETTPGYYGNFHGLTGEDFDAPFTIGGSYIVSPDLQWVLGIEVDINNRFPVLPGAGVRWKFAEKWVLNGILPTPRLEYSYSKGLMLFVGADVQMSTYYVDDNFGTAHGNSALNNALVNYTEIRTGAGVSWKITRNITAEVESGYMPYRDFNFYRANVDVSTNTGAPYGQLAITGRF
jgi:hypothetical protein